LKETANPYIKTIAITPLQDFWFQQDREPPHVTQVTCAVSHSTLPAKKNGSQEELQWSARYPDLFPISFMETFNPSCINTTLKQLIVLRKRTG
jgi:hypothetical protein